MRESGEAEGEDSGLEAVSAMSGFGQALLAGMPDSAAVVFDQDLRVRYAEGAALARAGLGPMVGRLLPDLMRADAWRELQEPYEAALDGRTTRFDFAGSISAFSIHVSPIGLPGGMRGGLAVSHAVSEQRRLESAIIESQDAAEASQELLRVERQASLELLREGERTLRAVIDNTPSVICVKGRDHRYQLVNRDFEEWCGVDSDRILGHTSEEMGWAAIVEHQRVKDQSVLDGADPFQEEEVMLRDGKERVFLTTRFPLLDEVDEIYAICCVSTDITERLDEERSKRERLQCSVEIHAALAQERFVLHGQPIVNLATMRVEQAELLVRMLRVRGGADLMSPAELLPTAERFGLIGLIDEWVVERAVEHAAAGHRVEVNLSAKTISDVNQVSRIEQKVLASGAPPQNLIFEITETAVADHLDAARDFALRLRKLGCAFALDDFGVGHGTFRYLRHLQVDYLKIDLQFVRDLLIDDADRDVVEAIIGVAKQFDIKTIAEGVEDQATLTELGRMGVDYAQGYWLGRPVPLAELWTPATVKGVTNAA